MVNDQGLNEQERAKGLSKGKPQYARFQVRLGLRRATGS